MSDFFPGDKVRFLNEDGEGVVVAVGSGGVMVRTADGFEIPYPEAQLVKFGGGLDRVQKIFNSTSEVEEVLDAHGIFIAYMKRVTDSCPVFLINRTSYDIYYSFCEKIDGNFKGRVDGQLPSGKFTEINSLYLSQVASWRETSLRVLYLGNGKELPEPKVFNHKVKAKTFLSNLTNAPLINKEAYLYQLDGDAWKLEQSKLKDQLKNIFGKNKPDEKAKDETKVFVPDVVDLHIEAIPTAPNNLGQKSILKFQVNYADEMLDKAIAAGMVKITFIHGAGDGVLKREIQKMAKANPHVSSFGKGDPKKYGGGATFLKIE
ncbi:MAG: Smr/MutS family protein [Bacteroidia bacterium]